MKKLLLLFVMIGTTMSLSAQIKGTVVSNNQPIEDAYIYNQTSKSHSHSNQLGQFEISNTNVGDVLLIGLLGYEKQEVTLTDNLIANLVIDLKPKAFMLDELVLSQPADVLSSIVQIDLETNPINSSQEILRKVPGLIIGQHAGGGKAEQLFLRGFDIDHGTDVALSVDGMPVNMVSHAHGQGYSDLHFLIPETIEKINFGKGPYYSDHGDFNTAGFVDFRTKSSLDNSTISFTAGQFNTLRTLGMFNLLENKASQNAYVALEYIETDGPFESPQNFDRLNLMGKYNAYLNDNSKLGLTVSHFTSKWDASGQIPVREVNNGNISNFGAIDDTEGGYTSRSNANVQFSTILDNDIAMQSNVFYSKYNFELYSNFTFFLEDPVNGDQIKQKENRDIFGLNTQFNKEVNYNSFDVNYTAGLGLRFDDIKDIELSHTLNRKTTLDYIQLGDVYQRNMNAFVNAEIDLGKFSITPGLRLEYFNFQYNNRLSETYDLQTNTEVAVLPKLNFQFNQNENLQWFLKSGIGFHSNDARIVLNNEVDKALPKAYGVDFGNIWKPTQKIVLNTTLWYLFSEEEFVYVGDAGIVEPSGESERYGLDLGVRFQLNDYFYFNTDATFTKARSLEAEDGEDYIPLAPDFTLVGGLSVKDFHKFSGAINYRYIDDRPANEDNSIAAEGYFVTDFNLNYSFNKHWKLGVIIENVFDTDWKETQFLTESRLQNEVAPVEEIHFTPGTPFNFRTTLSYSF
ncbi:TonB-dependent receptor domain-containing protein [Mesoflavibacter sp. SCSIO 43206]|uniref:TonB-dependent receptor n=1 Tax=Mesoflavibacter sp. SCSIO 43206 TaxID=2779362 RepID=UPI001CA9DA0F|nr:TonB-dependent receptor [Mesoflavibacter sp. SCSIO 43206]UAB75541.1 TonB-dependent receptor [Mesoflavibacter sp. SCSIO 43206]